MRIRQTCAYILMVGGMLLFAGASQAQSMSGTQSTGPVETMNKETMNLKNSGATSHGIPPPNAGEETVRGGPARMLGEVQTGMTSGRASSGSYDPFGNMGTSMSKESLGKIEAPGIGAGGNSGSIGGPGTMGSPVIGGSSTGVIGGGSIGGPGTMGSPAIGGYGGVIGGP
jgi:hypothetical protein